MSIMQTLFVKIKKSRSVPILNNVLKWGQTLFWSTPRFVQTDITNENRDRPRFLTQSRFTQDRTPFLN